MFLCHIFFLRLFCALLKLLIVPYIFPCQYDKESVIKAKFTELEQEACQSNPSDSSFFRTLRSNTDLLACKAEYDHQCGEYQKCFELTSA